MLLPMQKKTFTSDFDANGLHPHWVGPVWHRLDMCAFTCGRGRGGDMHTFYIPSLATVDYASALERGGGRGEIVSDIRIHYVFPKVPCLRGSSVYSVHFTIEKVGHFQVFLLP